MCFCNSIHKLTFIALISGNTWETRAYLKILPLETLLALARLMAYFLPKSGRLIYSFKIRTKRALLKCKVLSKTIFFKGRRLIILLSECFFLPSTFLQLINASALKENPIVPSVLKVWQCGYLHKSSACSWGLGEPAWARELFRDKQDRRVKYLLTMVVAATLT